MTKIKLCGLSREKEIRIANQLKVDYVGFVFAPSKRRISPQQAKSLKKELSTDIEVVGVFVNAPIQEIVQLVHQQLIDVIQLHGEETMAYLNLLQQQISSIVDVTYHSIKIIKAVRVKTIEQIRQADQWPVDFLLLDTYTQQMQGGCGLSFDWSIIPPKNTLRHPFFLAGGLTSNNVKQAIDMVHPYGVDVSSGVENQGEKDESRMNNFVKAVHEPVE